MPQVVEVPGMGDVEFPDDMTDEQIAAVIQKNIAPPKPFPDVYAGAGGFNPMLARLGGGALKTGESLGMTPENTASPLKNAAAPGELGLAFASGGVAMPLAGLVGAGQGLWNKLAPDDMRGPDAGDRTRQVQNALTYQPRTGAGAGMTHVAAKPFEAYAAGTNKVGEFVADKTGLPSLGAAIKTTGDIAPSLIGRGPQSLPVRGPKPTGKYVSTKWDVPTTERLKELSRAEYKAGEEAGVVVSPEGYGKALEAINGMAKGEGINPTLHPKSTAVLKVLDESNGKAMTLQEAETLRKIALDAEDDLNPVTREATPDARIAGKIVDELDERIDELSTNSEARAQWARSRRSQMIDRAIARAEIKAGAKYTQAGMENALRKEFQALALNDRRMRGLSKEQKEAIAKVAKGGVLENSMRALGKFDPTSGGMAAFASIGTSAAAAPLTGGISMGLPLLGIVGKRAATRMTSNNVNLAREALVGRGLGRSTAISPSKGTPTLQRAAPPAKSSAPQAPMPAKAPTAADLRRLEALEMELARLRRELSTTGVGQ